jgi:hypothetical protein
MDGVPDPNALPGADQFHTQSDYPNVLQSQVMETLRECPDLNEGNIDLQPSHQPHGLQPSQQPDGSTQSNDFLEIFEQNNNLELVEQVAALEAAVLQDTDTDIQLQFPTSLQDPGFVDESTNQLVLSRSSDIKPIPTPTTTIIHTNYSWAELCTRYLPHDQVQSILKAHAYNIFKVPNLIAMKTKNKSDTSKDYRCPCWKFRIRVVRYGTGRDRKWKIDPHFMQPGQAMVSGLRLLYHTPQKKIPYHEGVCDCSTSKYPLSQSVVANIPIIQSWIEQDLHQLKKTSTFTEIIKKGAAQDIYFNFKAQSQWTGIIQAVQDSIYLKSSKTYDHLPAFVKALTATNPNVSAALQNDSEGRFCRFWIGLPIAKYHAVLTQPIYVVDCFHSKCTMYGGVIMAFSSRTGFGRTVTEAAAWLPNESTPHLAWVVQMCKRHGMGLEDAIFTDQGPFLAAINALNSKFLLPFFVMLCLQHIFRNAYHNFGPIFQNMDSKNEFTTMMNAASFCEDQATFFETIFEYLHNKLETCDKSTRHLYISLVLYVFRLQPALWTVFGNAPVFNYDDYWKYMKDVVLPYLISSLYINLNYKEEHREFDKCCELIIASRVAAAAMTDAFLAKYEKAIFRTKGPCPRMFNTRTNIAESFAMTALSSGFRYEIPPVAIKIFIAVYNKQIRLLENDLSIMKKNMLTTTGSRIKTALARQGVMFDPEQTTFPDLGKYFKLIVDRTPRYLEESDNANHSGNDEQHKKGDSGQLLLLSPPSQSQCGSNLDQTQSQLDPIQPQDELSMNDDDDCDLSVMEENERLMETADNDDNDDSSVIQRVTVEGRFASVGGFAYKATLSWLHSTHVYVHDPVFKHSCHGCVHFSGMVQFPCYCILAVAKHSYKHDTRWPKDHAMIDGLLPASFYPPCFRSEENYHNITREELRIQLPTQEIINGFSSQPQVKAPPQYKGTVESGLRIPSIGEGKVSKARVAPRKKKKKSSTAGTTNIHYASEWARMAKVNPANPELAASLFGEDEQFVPSSQQSETIESTTNLRTTKEYHCSHCKGIGHTYPKCPKKAAAGAGVVKPKDIIVTGDYVVYSLREHTSDYTDDDKPTEIAALSSNQVNNPTFRFYNPDGDEKSELSNRTKKFRQQVGCSIDFKAMNSFFKRTNTETNFGKNVYKLNITKNNAMFHHVMSYSHENLNHYTSENPDIDCWEAADSAHCSNFESQLEANYKPRSVCQNIPQQMHLGSPSSLSPTESCILQKLDAVKDVAFDLINIFLEENSSLNLNENNSQNSNDQPALIPRLLLTRLIAKDGFQKTSEFLSQQTANRLSEALIPTPSTEQSGSYPSTIRSIGNFFREDLKASQYLMSQKSSQDQFEGATTSNFTGLDAAGLNGVCGIYKITDQGAINLCDDSDDDDIDDDNDDSNIRVFMDSDKETLKPGIWLNDVVVTLFFSLLQNTTNNKQKVFFLNSYIMTKMFAGGKEYNYDLVKSWAEELDLSNADYIYVPINITRSHWILGIIQPQQKLIEICDSGKFICGTESKDLYSRTYGHALLLFMEDRAGSRSVAFEKRSWTIVEKECPQQLNYTDCGVFVVVYALFHSQKLKIDYNQNYITDRRPEILFSLIAKKCHIELNYGENCRRVDDQDHVIKDKIIPLIELSAIDQRSRCTEVFVSKKKKKKNTEKGKEKENSEEPLSATAKTSTTATVTSQQPPRIPASSKAKTKTPAKKEVPPIDNEKKRAHDPTIPPLSATAKTSTATATSQQPPRLPASSKAKTKTPAKKKEVPPIDNEKKRAHDPTIPPIVTTHKKAKTKSPPDKKKRTQDRTNSPSSSSTSSSSYSFETPPTSPSDPDHDPDRVYTYNMKIDLYAGDTIKVIFNPSNPYEWSPPLVIFSIYQNTIELEKVAITRSARIMLLNSNRADLNTDHLNTWMYHRQLILHQGTIDGIYGAQRTYLRHQNTVRNVGAIIERCYGNGEELETAAAATTTTAEARISKTNKLEVQKKEPNCSPRRLTFSPDVTPSTKNQTHQSNEAKFYITKKGYGKKVCHTCNLPYPKFAKSHDSTHAYIYGTLIYCPKCHQEQSQKSPKRKVRSPKKFS